MAAKVDSQISNAIANVHVSCSRRWRVDSFCIRFTRAASRVSKFDSSPQLECLECFFFVSLLIFVCRVIDLCRRRCRFHSICCRLFLFRRRLSRAFAVISDRSETCFRLLLNGRFFFFAGPYRMQECLTGRRETESERANGLRNVNFNSE